MSPPRSASTFWLAFALLLVAFSATLISYGGVWAAQPYTHGWIIAAAAAWMVWNERDALRSGEGPWLLAGFLTAGLSLVWFVSAVGNMRAVAQAAVPLILFGWCAALFGRSAALRLVPVAAVALLAVPLWEVFTRPLQLMTIWVDGLVLGLLRIPATLEGDLVHLEHGTFLIATGCAGLNYLMSGLTVGGLYAYAFARRLSMRLSIVALAAALAIVGNWIRVSSLIALGQYTRMQSIFITDSLAHIMYGWTIFFLGLLAFFPLAGRIADRARAQPRAAVPSGSAGLVVPTRSIAFATLAAALGPLAFYGISAVPARDASAPVIGGAVADWSADASARPRPYGWQPAFVGVDEHLVEVWARDSATVVVDRMLYRDQDQGEELIGYMNAIAAPDDVLTEPFGAQLGPGQRIVNVAVVHDESAPVLVWYWYRVGGVETASPLKAKLLEVPAFIMRARTSELIAVSTACAATDCERATETLGNFFGMTKG